MFNILVMIKMLKKKLKQICHLYYIYILTHMTLFA